MRSVTNTATKEWLSMTLGVIAAVAILCTQSFTYTSSAIEETGKETKKEAPGNQDNDHHEKLPTISQDAVSSFVQLTISNGLHFITDIYHNTVEAVSIVFDQKVDYNSFFKTLFRLIISPNAP